VTEKPRPPVEFRNAVVADVNFAERVVSVVAAPYEEEALVEYRGELWQESFLRGAWDGIETRSDPIRANRDHDKTRTIGRALRWFPSREEGLVGEVRVAPTPLGDETLTLADEDMLSVSAGFGVHPSDQELDRPFRRIKRAFMDHLAFVESPAYAGARVLAVRDREDGPDPALLPPLVTPNLDEVLAWLKTRKS
jgi:phage head maturation protease